VSAEAFYQLPGRMARDRSSSPAADCRLQQFRQDGEPDCRARHAIDRFLEHGPARCRGWHRTSARDTHSGCGCPGGTLQSLQLRLLASGIWCWCARQRCHHRLPDHYVDGCRVARSGRVLAGCLPLWASRNCYPGGTPIPRRLTPKSRGAAETPTDGLKSLQSRDAMIAETLHTSNNSANRHRPTTTDAE
jgi:hypothetical protein